MNRAAPIQLDTVFFCSLSRRNLTFLERVSAGSDFFLLDFFSVDFFLVGFFLVVFFLVGFSCSPFLRFFLTGSVVSPHSVSLDTIEPLGRKSKGRQEVLEVELFLFRFFEEAFVDNNEFEFLLKCTLVALNQELDELSLMPEYEPILMGYSHLS